MVIIFKLLAVFLCAVMDRLRGDQFNLVSRSFEKFIYGLTIAVLSGIGNPWGVLLMACAFAIGSSPGLSEPMGAALEHRAMVRQHLEYWQIGVLGRSTQAACIARGLIWAMPMVPVAWCFGGWAGVIGTAAAFPLMAPVSARVHFRCPALLVRNFWEQAEFVRGLLVGAITLALFTLT